MICIYAKPWHQLTRDVLGGICWYTPYTNLWCFLTAYAYLICHNKTAYTGIYWHLISSVYSPLFLAIHHCIRLFCMIILGVIKESVSSQECWRARWNRDFDAPTFTNICLEPWLSADLWLLLPTSGVIHNVSAYNVVVAVLHSFLHLIPMYYLATTTANRPKQILRPNPKTGVPANLNQTHLNLFTNDCLIHFCNNFCGLYGNL